MEVVEASMKLKRCAFLLFGEGTGFLFFLGGEGTGLVEEKKAKRTYSLVGWNLENIYMRE
jgi:hypothetical protein